MQASNGFLCERVDSHAVLTCGYRQMRITFINERIVRVTYTHGNAFLERPSRIVTADRSGVAFTLDTNTESYVLSTRELSLTILRESGSIEYARADGTRLTREPGRGGKWLTPKPVLKNIFRKEQQVAYRQSTDGARAQAAEYETVVDRMAFEAKLEFEFADDEAIYGLGSHEEGYGNLRGCSRELYQQNMKAVVPCFVSTRGYSVLLECGSLMTFHDDALGSYWWADVVDELDVYLIAGRSFDEVTRGYYQLTGAPPMLPKWSFGYLQSKERYVNAREMIDVVREYRRRRIPLDGIVLDWKSWPDGNGWGQKSLDPVRFPDPHAFVEELHALGAHLMVSIWPIMTGGCADQKELLAADLMLGNQSTYDAFVPQARAAYWQQAHRGLFQFGIDAWWCDCTEPFEADWAGAVKLEPHTRLEINTRESKLYLDPTEINFYSLLHSQGIYEGQRCTTANKRVLNLTRSSYAGQHRYATVTWNGDVTATWETLRRSIPEGVNFCATGEPYWTVDAGGFFLDTRPDLWFWRGDYPSNCRGLTDPHAQEPDMRDTGSTDLGYWELYTRWLQYAAFLPMFRSHGTDAAREVWRFGEEGTPFYEAICQCIRLRYRLLPYIYSLAAQVVFDGAMMVRALALEFPSDRATQSVLDQYLFGRGLMVCPVVQPMYYEAGSNVLASQHRSRAVYLPSGCAWIDFWTDERSEGGQMIDAPASLDLIPLFIRAGSILPMTGVGQCAQEAEGFALELHVYPGADGRFVLYDDAGDGYDYEAGAYAQVPITWTDKTSTLTLDARQGTFPGMAAEREIVVTLHGKPSAATRRLLYRGDAHSVQFLRDGDGE